MYLLIEDIKISNALKAKGGAKTNSLRLQNLCGRFFLFSYLNFRFHFACYPPESFKTICLTCIWSEFIDTIFHLRKARNKSLPHRHGGVRGRVHFSLLGAKLYFHVNTTRKNSIVLTTNMAALSRDCKPRTA